MEPGKRADAESGLSRSIGRLFAVAEDYPDQLPSTDEQSHFELRYLHDPSDPADGITACIPLAELPHLPDMERAFQEAEKTALTLQPEQ